MSRARAVDSDVSSVGARRPSVAVVGGGVAGMSAALSSARSGAETTLLERTAELGGVWRAGLGFPVCGWFDDAGKLLNEGLCRELFEAVGGQATRMGRTWVWPGPAERLTEVFRDRLAAEPRLRVLTKTAATEIERDAAGRVVRVGTNAGDLAVDAVVDCSGEAVATRLAGASILKPDRLPLAGFSVRLRGVDASDELLPLKVAHVLRDAPSPVYARFASFAPPDLLKLAVAPTCAVAEARRAATTTLEALRAALPAFARAEAAAFSPEPLRREGIRMRGRHVLTKEELLSGKRVADAAARCAWPVEYWDPERGPQLEYFSAGTHGEVPADCLISSDCPNLLAAGRCLSATSGALASLRVAGVCIATGEAAGRLAANVAGESGASFRA